MISERYIFFKFTNKLDKILIYYLSLLFFFVVSIVGFEIIKFQDYVKEKFYDRSIQNFHFCQWAFYNSTSAIENEILQFNYFEYTNSNTEISNLKNLFKYKFNYSNDYDKFCEGILYCGIYYVI